MNEQDIAKKIAQYLNFGANRLDRPVLLRLQSARQEALEAHARPRRSLNLALAGGGEDDDHHGARHLSPRFWVSLALLLLGLLVAVNWQTMNDSDAQDEMDAILLAEDLPVHAYLDSDFDTWLEQSSLQ